MSNKTRQSIETVSNSIISILSVLDGVTPTDIQNPRTLSISLNPFNFIISILQNIVGHDEIINYISELVVNGLPLIENAAKIALMQALRNLFSCTLNPIISGDLINEGVVLDMKSLDLLNIMSRCPLDNENSLKKINGSFFYFDVDGFSVPDQLVMCQDLNAVIWYVKHRAKDRTVWYGYQTQGDEHESITESTKMTIEDGIITMEYAEKASDIKDSMNNPLSVTVPLANSLHVFLGNTKGFSNVQEPSSENALLKTRDFQQLLESLKDCLRNLENDLNEQNIPISRKSELQCEISLVRKIINAIYASVPIIEILPNLLVDPITDKRYFDIENQRIRMTEYTYTHSQSELAEDYKEIYTEKENWSGTLMYRRPEDNYYYHKTLFEFNTDYIMSVKFFDSKVVMAQIVNILTGCFDIGVEISFEERLIQNEVEKLLSRIIESGDVIVNDSFFTFTNDEYNQMVEDTEMERLGRYTGDDYAYGTQLDYGLIYDELNKVSGSATQSEQISVFNGAINTISRTIKPEIYSSEKEWNLNFNFINNVLRGLTLSLVYNIVSPKMYMLMAINLKVMGQNPNFDLVKFIELFKSLLITVIRGITDKIIEKLKEWLLSLISNLVKQLSDKLMLEQAEYYMRLLMKCLRALSIYRGYSDWNMADVNYADIYTVKEITK